VDYQRHVIMGFSTENPKFYTAMNIEDMLAGYAHSIINKRGWRPAYGTVYVRGVLIDIDAIAPDYSGKESKTDEFLWWLQIAARRAG
jgi:hypothetical protein